MISFDDEDIQTLVKLGLTSSQAKIYLTLVTLEVADAKKIAQTAGIDRAETYRQLNVLQKKALIEKILSVPNKYKPMDLKETLRLLIQQKSRENAEIQEKVGLILLKEFHAKTIEEEEEQISVIPKGEYARRHIITILKNVHKELLWYTPIGRIPLGIHAFFNATENVHAKGIQWRAIAELNKPTEEIMRFIQNYQKEHPNFSVRFVNPILSLSFVIWDNAGMNFFIDKPTGSALGSKILATNNAQLIKIIKDYFELRWNSAMIEYPEKGE